MKSKYEKQKKILESAVEVLNQQILSKQTVLEILREDKRNMDMTKKNVVRLFELCEAIGREEAKMKQLFEVKISLMNLIR